MAKKNDGIVKVLTANAKGTLKKEGYSLRDLNDCNAIVRELSGKGDPMSRYQIAEVTNFVVDNLLKETEDFMNQLGEVVNVGVGEKAQFNVGQNEVTAYIQAKGGTPMRTKIANKYVAVDTVEIAARPYMNFQDLATGRLDFTRMASSAAREITNKKMLYIQNILNAAVKEIGGKAYVSINDTDTATMAKAFNAALANFRRQAPGNTRIVGDVAVLDKIDELASAYHIGSDVFANYDLIDGYVGKYKGCDVIAYENPIVDWALNPLLSTNLIYFVAGTPSPLKIVNEGSVRTMEQQNIDDESYEMVLRQDFGAALVVGHHTSLGIVEIA